MTSVRNTSPLAGYGCTATGDSTASGRTITVPLVRPEASKGRQQPLARIAVTPLVPLGTRVDLAAAYTPGVATHCQLIAERPQEVRRLTVKGNSVAVVTDGSAVLGLGDLGPTAALPVMEGKAALLRHFAGVDAWPVCLATRDVDEIVRTVELISPAFGGVNLEDIAAPRCFEIERRLAARLDIPVFHDDQHGTAIVVLAALLNALRVVGKTLSGVRVVLLGAGAAGSAVARLLLTQGVQNLTICDRQGVLRPGQPDLSEMQRELAARSAPVPGTRTLRDALSGADVLIGLSTGGAVDVGDLAGMARRAVVFALANPEPEIDPEVARRYAEVVATGASDAPNQINNLLVFPGVFRGLLDAGARRFTPTAASSAARALAALVDPDNLGPTAIVPSVFDPRVVPTIAASVYEASALDGG